MLRFCEACDGCSFYFLASLIKNLLVKAVFGSYCLKLKYFLIFAYFQPHISYRRASYKKTCIHKFLAMQFVELLLSLSSSISNSSAAIVQYIHFHFLIGKRTRKAKSHLLRLSGKEVPSSSSSFWGNGRRTTPPHHRGRTSKDLGH